MAGAVPPALLVLKNRGSMSEKSPSACMRSIRTEPTMPRQPTRPTSFDAIFKSFVSCLSGSALSLQRGQHGLAHFRGAHLARAFAVDVGRAQPLLQHRLHGRLDASC